MPFDPRYYVTFTASSGLTISVLADDTSATLTSGFGGWEAVDRPKRTQMTRYKGKPLFKQDVPIMFDGLRDGRNVEIEVSTLIRMSQQAGALAPPPTVKINGPVEREDLIWVIEDITWNSENVIRDISGGSSVRMRQSAVVHLLQFMDDKVIVTPARPKVAAKVVDPKGKTPKQLAHEHYGDPNFWSLFLPNNPLIKHPRQKLQPGVKVIIPPPPSGTTAPPTKHSAPPSGNPFNRPPNTPFAPKHPSRPFG